MAADNFYVYGRNSVIEALESGKALEKIFILYGTQGSAINKIFSLANKNKTQCVSYSKDKFTVLEKKACPVGAKAQGVIALESAADYYSIEELINNSYKDNKKPIIVLLDGIEDPHNLGAIARSAECAGVAGIIIPERNSCPITPTAIKTSAGALQHIPCAKVSNINFAIDKLKKAGFWIIGSDASATKFYYDDLYDSPLGIIIGSEGKGMRQSITKHCDIVVKIPMPGKTNSLNSSVAAGIILFEIVKQRSL